VIIRHQADRDRAGLHKRKKVESLPLPQEKNQSTNSCMNRQKGKARASNVQTYNFITLVLDQSVLSRNRDEAVPVLPLVPGLVQEQLLEGRNCIVKAATELKITTMWLPCTPPSCPEAIGPAGQQA